MHRQWLLAVCCAAMAGGAERLTLQQAQERALRQHPRLEAARSQAEAAGEVPAEITARLKPQAVALSTGAYAEDGNTRVLAGGLNNPIILNRWAAGVTVSQMITDFGRTKRVAASARLRANAADEAVKVTRAGVLLRVAQAYYAALSAQAVRKVAAETVRTRTVIAERAATLAANQLRSDLDVSFARVDLQEARLLESNAANGERSAQVELAAAMGLADAPEFDLVDDAPPDAPAEDWDAVVKTATANRPEIGQAQWERRAADALVQAEKALWFPSIGAAFTSGVAPAHSDRLQGHWNAAGITLDLPLLNGGLFRARQREAGARAAAAAAQVRDATNQVVRDVRVAYLNMTNAQERLRLTGDLLEQAKRSYELAKARYDLGLGNIVELSQAQLNLTRAEITQATARFDYQASRVALDYQRGTL